MARENGVPQGRGDAIHAALLATTCLRVLANRDDRGKALQVENPMGYTIGTLVAVDDAHLTARRVLAMEDIYGADMADDEAFVTTVGAWYEALLSHGVLDTLRASGR